MSIQEPSYFVELKFDETSPFPCGTRMHFSDLNSAFRKLINFCSFGFYRQNEAFPYNGRILKEARLFRSREKIALAELTFQDQRMANTALPKTPGIYFNFPNGITDFEQKSGLRFSDFKEYDKTSNILLASYLVSSPQTALKDSIGFLNMEKLLEKEQKNKNKNVVNLTQKFFGDGGQRNRDVYPTTFTEQYYFDDANTAIQKLLSINFNMLGENIAWENDQQSYYSRANVTRGSFTIASFFTVGDSPVQLFYGSVRRQGLHLELPNNLEYDGITLPLGNLLKEENAYFVGEYNKFQNRIKKVPGLKSVLGYREVNTAPENTVKAGRKPKVRYKGKGI